MEATGAYYLRLAYFLFNHKKGLKLPPDLLLRRRQEQPSWLKVRQSELFKLFHRKVNLLLIDDQER